MEILWLAAAYFCGLLFQQLRLPALLGYLFAGLLLSFSGLPLNTGLIHEIGHLGVLILLFTVGLHLRLKNIIRPEVLAGGGLHLLISASIFGGLAFAFGYSPLASLITGTMLGFSSTVLAAKTLESRGELGAYHARVAIGILILQDVFAIIILAFTGGKSPTLWTFSLLLFPVLRPVFLFLLRQNKQDELQLLFGVILAIGSGTLFAELGLSSELGALIAGALLAGQKEADEMGEKLWGLKEIFIVGFFLEVGLSGLPDADLMIFGAILLLLLPLKSILFFFLMVAFKLRSRNAFMVSSTLSSYSEFTLIAGVAAAKSGFIPEEIVTMLALVTASSFAINAPIAERINSIWKKWEYSLIPLERKVKHPGDQVVNFGVARYLILGMGQAGTAAYDYLKQRELPVIGMDIDPARIQQNLKEKRRVVYGDAQDPELWQNSDISEISSIILALPNHNTKISATEFIRESGFKNEILALSLKSHEQEELKHAGATSVTLPITEAGRKLAELSVQQDIHEHSLSLQIK